MKSATLTVTTFNSIRWIFRTVLFSLSQKHLKFVLVFLLFLSPLYSQSVMFKSMKDNGVLVTRNGDTILPYGVKFISMEEDSIYDRKFLNNMHKWLTDYFVNRYFEIVITDTISEKKYHGKIFREMLVNSSDAIDLLVLYGYAMVDTTINNQYTVGLMETQKKAINEKNGIWRTSSKATNNSKPKPQEVTRNNNAPVYTHKIDFPLFTISLLSFGLAYDFFAQVSDLSDLISEFHKIGIKNTSNLEGEKTRKTILGVLSIVAGTVSFISSWETIQIEGGYNKINLKYKF